MKLEKLVCVFSLAVVCAAGSAFAQVLTPATGVANDHGQGATRPLSVVYVPRTAETGYGYEDGMTVLGFTFLPWAAPNSSWDVRGVRLNLGWGAYRDTKALDFGVFSSNAKADGLFINWFGTYVEGDSRGWQNGLANVVGGTMSGLQIGIVNWAEKLQGVQIGLLNFAHSQHFFPVINIAW